MKISKLEQLGFHTLGQSIGLTLGRQIISIPLLLATSVIIARCLGPEGKGQFAIAMLLPTFLATFFNMGIAPSNAYHVGRGSIRPREALTTNLFLWGVLSLAGLLAGALSIHFRGELLFPGIPVFLLWIALISFPIALLQGFVSSILQGVQDFRRYNLSTLASPALMLALVTAFLVAGGAGISVLIFLFLIVQAADLSITCVLLRPILASEPPGSTRPWRQRAKELAIYGSKAHMSNILAFVNYRADIFLTNFMIGPSAVGVYVIAVALSEKLWLLSQAVSTVLLPRLAELESGEAIRKQVTPIIARWVLVSTAIAAVALGAFCFPLIRILFGADFMPAVQPLLILLPGIVMGSLSRVLANDIAARGRPELNTYTSVIVVTVNVGGNLLMIPIWGIGGAALATTIAYSLNAFTRLCIYSCLSGNPWHAPLLPGQVDRELLEHIFKRNEG